MHRIASRAAVALAFVMAFFGAVPAFADELVSEPLTFEIAEDGTAKVTACDYEATEVVIPSEIEGHAVTGIGEEAFDSHTDLVSVSIPSSVTTIEDYAFWGCSSLETVTLAAPADLPLGVFQDCESLTSIIIPEGVTKIGEEAFSGCVALEGVTLPGTLELIDCEAFYGCEELVSVSFPSNLKTLGENSFKNCYALESVEFPDAMDKIGFSAFSYCESLEQVKLPTTVGDMGTGIFSDCTALASATLPTNLTEVPDWTFASCEALTSVTVPASITAVGESAFDGCKALSGLELPTAITTLGPRAFAGCASMASLAFPALESLGSGAFAQCDALISVDLGTKITELPANAFYGCDLIERIALPATVKSIGYQAFDSCAKLTRVNVPKGTETIAGCAFRNCKSLLYLGIPSSVTSIGIAAFEGMANPSTIYVTTQEQLELLEWQEDYLSIDRTKVVLIDEDSKATITRVFGDTAEETSAQISQVAFPDGCRTAILSRNDDFADAMSATGLAGTIGAPIVLTDRTELSVAARDELSRLGVREVLVIGGPGAIKSEVVDGLAQVKGVTKVTRIYGEYSWDTSVACAREIEARGGNPGQRSIVAMSSNFQDALSISSFAYKYGVPILLEDQSRGTVGELTGQAKAYIDTLAGEIYVPGGPGAVAEDTVEGTFPGRTVVRMWGEDGYDTSAEVATKLIGDGLLDPGSCYFACGAQAPRGVDALAGAALAGKNGGPMLLVNGNAEIEDVNLVTLEQVLVRYAPQVQRVAVLGGSFVMPGAVIDDIRDAIQKGIDATHPDFGW